MLWWSLQLQFLLRSRTTTGHMQFYLILLSFASTGTGSDGSGPQSRDGIYYGDRIVASTHNTNIKVDTIYKQIKLFNLNLCLVAYGQLIDDRPFIERRTHRNIKLNKRNSNSCRNSPCLVGRIESKFNKCSDKLSTRRFGIDIKSLLLVRSVLMDSRQVPGHWFIRR